MNVEYAILYISEVVVSTFRIFLGFSPEFSLFICLRLTLSRNSGTAAAPQHPPPDVSQTMFLCSFNVINSAHSVLLKLIYFTNAQVNVIVSF